VVGLEDCEANVAATMAHVAQNAAAVSLDDYLA
jgi:hypothetical protein